MPNVLNEFVGDGVTRTFNFSMTGGYLSRDFVVFLTRPNDSLLEYTPYTGTVTWVSDFTVEISEPIPVGTTFVITRKTTPEALIDFQTTSRLTEHNLDTAFNQSLHRTVELDDLTERRMLINANLTEEAVAAAIGAEAATVESANAARVAQSLVASAERAAVDAAASAQDATAIADEALELVQQAVKGNVDSFNGRDGSVIPEAGDYSPQMVGFVTDGYLNAEPVDSQVPAWNDPYLNSQAQALVNRTAILKDNQKRTPLVYATYAEASAAAATLQDGQGVKTAGVEYRVDSGGLVPVKVVERFFTRQAFVTFLRKDLIPNGAVVEAGGERYLAEAGSGVIDDLPGFVPFGYVSPTHWGDASTVAFEKSLQYAADFDLEWVATGKYSLDRNIEIILRSDKAHTLKLSPAGRLVITGTQTAPTTSGWTENTGAWTPGDISYNSDQLIKVTNEIVVSGVTSAPSALGSTVVQLNANLISVGDLVVLTTSIPIPVESRGGKNTFGQVVKVIGKTQTSITIAEQLECAIPSGSRFEAYRPSTLIIGEGLCLKRAPTTNAVAGDLGFRGLTVLHLDKPLVTNADIDGFSECGLRFVECYKPRAEINSVARANRAYDTSGGTGYGISVIGCYAYKGRGNSFTGCRRGSDLGTFGITAWYCEEESSVTTSGGVTYTGAKFFPEGVQYTSAVGGHGPSYYSDFVNAKAINCRYHHNLRGLKERVIGGSHVGYGNSLGLIYGSGGSTIDGVQYLDGGRDGVYPAGYDHDLRMRWAVGIHLPAVESTLPITIKNLAADSLVQGFIFLDAEGGSGVAPEIRTVNNAITAVKTSSVNHFQGVYTHGNVRLKSGTDFSGINYRVAGTKYGIDWLINTSSNLYLSSGDYIRVGNNQWIISISNDTAVPFPIYSNSDLCIVDVWDNANEPKYIGLSIALGLGRGMDVSPLTATNRYNVTVFPSPLTGTTGTAGHVTISTAGTGSTAGRVLNIENRTGSATYVRLRISQA